MNRLNKTEPAVFLYCRFSLFLKDPIFQIIYCCNVAFRVMSLFLAVPWVGLWSTILSFPGLTHLLFQLIMLFVFVFVFGG